MDILTKDIKKKILEADLKTDSDIEDFSEETGISFDDVLRVLLNNNDYYNSCHGCKFILNRAYSLVGKFGKCGNCSRIHKVEDRYVPDLRFVD